MANPALISGALLASGLPVFHGLAWPPLCLGIGLAVADWLTDPLAVRVAGITSGVIGSGSVDGEIIFPGSTPLYAAAFAGSGILGVQAVDMASTVSLAMVASLSGSRYQGQSIGVSVGTDISNVVFANERALEESLLEKWAIIFGNTGGDKRSALARGLSLGVAGQVLLGFGVGVVTAPAAGTVAAVGTSPFSQVV